MKDLAEFAGLPEQRPIVTALQRDDVPWYVVHTQPRREHVAEANLRAVCPRLLCPRYRRRGILHGYVREIVRPLFPNYLFAAFDAGKDFRAVHYAHGVRGVVAFGGELAVVPPELLVSIETHMQIVFIGVQVQENRRLQRDGRLEQLDLQAPNGG